MKGDTLILFRPFLCLTRWNLSVFHEYIITLRYVPCTHSLSFIIKGYLHQSKRSCGVCPWVHLCGEFCLLIYLCWTCSYISGMKSAWSQWMIFWMCSWIRFASILWRNLYPCSPTYPQNALWHCILLPPTPVYPTSAARAVPATSALQTAPTAHVFWPRLVFLSST